MFWFKIFYFQVFNSINLRLLELSIKIQLKIATLGPDGPTPAPTPPGPSPPGPSPGPPGPSPPGPNPDPWADGKLEKLLFSSIFDKISSFFEPNLKHFLQNF